MEKEIKKEYLGSCLKTDFEKLVKDKSGKLLPFTSLESVMFVFCKSCQSIFEANREVAGNLIFSAKTFLELEDDGSEEKIFPKELLREKPDYSKHYLEISSCNNCDKDGFTTWVWVKKFK